MLLSLASRVRYRPLRFHTLQKDTTEQDELEAAKKRDALIRGREKKKREEREAKKAADREAAIERKA